MATNVNWFVIWVPSSSTEMRKRRDTASELKKNTKSFAEMGESGDISMQDSSSHLERVTSVVSTAGRFAIEVKKDGDSKDIVESAPSRKTSLISTPSRKTSLISNKTVTDESEIKQNGIVMNCAEPRPASQHSNDVSNQESKEEEDGSESEDEEKTIHDAFLELETMEDIVRRVIKDKDIASLHIVSSDDDKQTQFSFSVTLDRVEDILIELQSNGIGKAEQCTISVFPATFHVALNKKLVRDDAEIDEAAIPRMSTVEDKIDKFYSSIKSRLLVGEVIARIEAGSEFSFDFLLLLILAGIIAFMGLLESSSVVLVASMLVSPIMGPILAGIFGGAIQDRNLTWSGIRHEIYSLIICIIIGFVLGMCIVPWIGTYGPPQFPTPEMVSRGELRSLWVGVLIAVPSGAGVALSVLGGNAGSLVGVAISASLLPPAVNCGLCWAVSVYHLIRSHSLGYEDTSLIIGYSDDSMDSNSTHNGYVFRHATDSFCFETFILGLVSLTLTLVNILCIIITGVLILRLKEVTPAKVPQKFSHFWKTDVKAHREYCRAIKKGERLEKPDRDSEKETDPGDRAVPEFVQAIWERVEEDQDLATLRHWIPTAPSTRERAPTQGLANDPWGHKYQRVPLGDQMRAQTINPGYTPVYGGQNLPDRRSIFRQKSTNNPNGFYSNVEFNIDQEIKKSKDFRRLLRKEKGLTVNY